MMDITGTHNTAIDGSEGDGQEYSGHNRNVFVPKLDNSNWYSMVS